MKNMYEITPRGNEYIYGKILLDNFNVCHSCRQFYPIDRCPDAVLADPKLLSKKSVYDFIISDKEKVKFQIGIQSRNLKEISISLRKQWAREQKASEIKYFKREKTGGE